MDDLYTKKCEKFSDVTKENFERTQRLWDNNIGSEMQYLKSKTDYEASKKMVDQMKDRLSKTKISTRSSLGGLHPLFWINRSK